MAGERVLVIGATGQQGGAVARSLLKRGHAVRALVRDASSAAATYLGRLGVELRAGDLDMPESIERAARGVDAAYVMTTPFERGPDVETRQGIDAIEAIATAGARHVVLASVAGADRQTGIPHFDSKYRIEQRLRAMDVPSTVLAPVFFMENLLAPAAIASVRAGRLALPLPATVVLQQVALADLGAFAALVIERGEPFFGKRIEVASDELDGETAARLFSDVLGREIRYEQVPIERVRSASDDAARMFEWFAQVGYHADVAGLRSAYPELGWHRFEAWLRTCDRAMFLTDALGEGARQRRDLR